MTTEVRPGIRVVTDRIDATTLTVTILGDEEGMLVDTGLPGTPEAVILPSLRELGRPPAWVATVVNTHCHTDHSGGNAAVLAATEARLLVHSAEVPYVADPLAFVRMMQERYGTGSRPADPDPEEVRRQYGPGTPPDAALEDGDHLLVDGREWRVIHTPGHSPGGICLYEADTRTLITGDAIQAEGTTSCDLAFYFEADAYGRSLERVGALEVETIIAGHPFKPFPTAVLTGSEARRFISVSQAAHARYREQIEAILRRADRILGTEEVAAELTRRNGFDRCVGPAIQTTRAHLEQLRALGIAERVYRHDRWSWRRAAR